MQNAASKAIEGKVLGNLSVVRRFRQVINNRDMTVLDRELYQFLNLYCGFIAHYNIHGFKEAYAAPRSFTDVFIRHFDRDHRYFCGNYPCHNEPYQDTGFTKAEIKQEFFRIVEIQKNAIVEWADGVEKSKRYALFRKLKDEFEPKEAHI